MKLLALHRLCGPADRLYDLLSGKLAADMLIVSGPLGQEAAELLRRSLRPVLRVCADGEEAGAECGWPLCRPLAAVYDGDLRLLVHAAGHDLPSLRNMALRYRASLCLAPAFSATTPQLDHRPPETFAVGQLPPWPELLLVENFFSSLQVSRLHVDGGGKLAEISFFW